MSKEQEFLKAIKKNNFHFITGVPDSLFKNICLKLEKKFKFNKHVVASNEGSSIGLAIGNYLATGKVPFVYLQNSGIGNIYNPLVSLADEKVYKIPILLFIGWRGEILRGKQIKDEPQHTKQGKITEKTLKLLGIKYKILNSSSNLSLEIKKMKKLAIKNSCPTALLVRKKIFSSSQISLNKKTNLTFNREKALKKVFEVLPNKFPKISTTGMLSRELNELNIKNKCEKNSFLTVGGMGHAISIATGIALSKPKKKIICLDGDGAMLMHMGSSATSAQLNNILHILFNNNCHDSVGGQKTSSDKVNFLKIAKGFGYKNIYSLSNTKMIGKTLKKALKKKTNTFIEIKCTVGHRENLTRPKNSPQYNKKIFMEFLKN